MINRRWCVVLALILIFGIWQVSAVEEEFFAVWDFEGDLTGWESWEDKSRAADGKLQVESYSYITDMEQERNYRVDFDAKVESGGLYVPAVYIRADETMDGYRIELDPVRRTIALQRVEGGQAQRLGQAEFVFPEEEAHFFIQMNGDIFQFGQGDTLLLEVEEEESRSGGSFAADCGDGRLVLDNVRVSAISNPEDEYYQQNPSMDYQKSPYGSALLKADALGFLPALEDGGYKPNRSVTRAELAQILVRMMQVSSLPTQANFTDMQPSDAGYKEAAYCISAGWLELKNGQFCPTEAAEYGETVRAMTLISGRKALKEESELEYLVLASQAGITKGIQTEGALNRGEMAQIIMNTAQCPLMTISAVGSTTEYSTRENETILTAYHGIYTLEGRVLQNSRSGLYEASGCREGLVRIGDYEVETGDTDIEEYLGWYVEFYARENQDHDTFTMVYFSADERWNEPLKIEADAIAQETTTETFIYEQDGKTKTIKLPKNLIYLYNGTVAAPTDQQLKPEVGSVTLLRSDGEYFAAVIASYDTMYVGSIAYESGEIYDKYLEEKKLVLDESVCSYTIYSGGKQVPITQIYQNRVISVAQSAGEKKHYTIYVSDARISGTLEEEQQERPSYCVIDGVQYRTLSYGNSLYQGKLVRPKIATQVTAYLDYEGRIAFMTPYRVGEGFGYLALVKPEKGLEGGFRAGIFTAEGLWVKELLAEKVWINGTSRDCTSELPQELTQPQIVEFKQNAQGKITMINTSQEGTYGSASLVNGPSYKNVKYVSANTSLDAKVYLDYQTVVISVPENRDNLEEYMSGKRAYFQDGKTYTVQCYNVNEFDIPQFVVVDESGDTASVPKLARIFVVDNMTQAVDIDGDVYQSLHGYTNGKQATIKVRSGSESAFDGLERGDAILISENARGEAVGYTEVYRKKSGYLGSNNPDASMSVDRLIVSGSVEKLDRTERRARLNVSGNEVSVEKAYYFGNAKAVYVYSEKTDTLSVSSVTNIDVGDFVVCNFCWSALNDMIIYKD